jgi:hypothetical protein
MEVQPKQTAKCLFTTAPKQVSQHSEPTLGQCILIDAVLPSTGLESVNAKPDCSLNFVLLNSTE